jgi:hypothetical protein
VNRAKSPPPLDPSILAVERFLNLNGNVIDSPVEAMGYRIMSITSDGMSYSLYSTVFGRPDLSQDPGLETRFRWSSVKGAHLLRTGETEWLVVSLNPSGLMRFQDPRGKFWRRGSVPVAGFEFQNEGIALKFFELIRAAAIQHGAHLTSDRVSVGNADTPNTNGESARDRSKEDAFDKRMRPE